MDKSQILERIKQLAIAVLPQGSSLWLYGSRARGDECQSSDWDLLILLDKSKITSEDYDLAYFFRKLGNNQSSCLFKKAMGRLVVFTVL